MLLFDTREQLQGQCGFRMNDADAGRAAALPFLPPTPTCSSTARALNVHFQDMFGEGMDVSLVKETTMN